MMIHKAAGPGQMLSGVNLATDLSTHERGPETKTDTMPALCSRLGRWSSAAMRGLGADPTKFTRQCREYFASSLYYLIRRLTGCGDHKRNVKTE
jgi:hypothetical protein